MDPLIVVLTVVICIFALVFVIAGIQVILVLQEIKKTLQKVNAVADTIEHVALRTVAPLAGLGGTIEGVKSGMKVVQAFVGWLNRDKDKYKEEV